MCCNINVLQYRVSQTCVYANTVITAFHSTWWPCLVIFLDYCKRGSCNCRTKAGGVYCRNNLNIYGFYPSDVSDLIHLRFQWTFSYSLMNVLNWFDGFDLCKGGHTMSICKSYFENALFYFSVTVAPYNNIRTMATPSSVM